ncbi:hypothetical protein C8R45DRAFT_1110494 [Mycena sanguinolenta]|nr:hypothetical protein C8R45DRAFT_1110494 [Mycena sanguinolenta]
MESGFWHRSSLLAGVHLQQQLASTARSRTMGMRPDPTPPGLPEVMALQNRRRHVYDRRPSSLSELLRRDTSLNSSRSGSPSQFCFSNRSPVSTFRFLLSQQPQTHFYIHLFPRWRCSLRMRRDAFYGVSRCSSR